jgi:dipeptidyl aminopeptidase/acylaminoacyl peptidase
MKVVFCLLVLFVLSGEGFSQSYSSSIVSKPPIDSSVYGKWPYLSETETPKLTNDGRYVAYAIYNVPTPEDNSTLFIQSTDALWKMQIVGLTAGDVSFSNDSRYALYIKRDTLTVLNLQSKEKQLFPSVTSFKISKEGDYIAYLGKEGDLTLKNFQSAKELKFSSISDYYFAGDGRTMLLQKEADKEELLQWVQLIDAGAVDLYRAEKISNYCFDATYSQLAFLIEQTKGKDTKYSIGYYKNGAAGASVLVTDQSLGLDSSWTVANGELQFSEDGGSIIFKIKQEKAKTVFKNEPSVDVWSYQDQNLQPYKLAKLQREERFPPIYYAVVNITSKKTSRINDEGETLQKFDKVDLINNNYDHSYDFLFKPYKPSYFLYNSQYQSKKFIVSGIPLAINSSLDGKFTVYWSSDKKRFLSFNTVSYNTEVLGKDIASILLDNTEDVPGPLKPFGIARFYNSMSILLYDQYDIWMVDLEGKKPSICITNEVGRRNGIILRLARLQINDEEQKELTDTAILIAFNPKTKENGFYKLSVKDKNLRFLTMDANAYQIMSHTLHDLVAVNLPIIKARNESTYIVTRQSATEPPNLFCTTDFKHFARLTDIQPQKNYNWLTTELITWKMPDGRYSQGILYKPENFDPKKKYPLIYNCYEKLSNGLNVFKTPDWSSSNIDIPTYVSNGYLVFTPDVYFTIGRPGESIVNSVVSAAKYLSTLPYVDAKRIGIQGHSYGGYEVNYLVTHSDVFAAAAEAAGLSDMISGYGAIGMGNKSLQLLYEKGQNRIGNALWQKPDLYIENSPIFRADKITTPLLIMHNKEDDAVPWAQGLEMFNACRRLGKPCWLLSYNCRPGQGHQLTNIEQSKDYTFRMQQFFDHYLRGMAAPLWMTKGIPAKEKGLFSGMKVN